MKRTLSALLTAALVLGLAVVPASAAGSGISQVGYIAPDAGYRPVNNKTTIENDRLLVSNGDNSGNALYGYADSTGKLVIPIQYRNASVFHDGVAVVALEDWSYALIDPDGNYIVEPKEHQSIKEPIDGDGLFYVSGQGYIDSHGEMVIPTTSYNATSFYCGSAYFQEGQSLYVVHWDEDTQAYIKEVQCELPANTFIGRRDDVFTARGNTTDIHVPSDYAVVEYKVDSIRKGFGVVDRTGKLVISTDYDNITPYPNGIAIVTKSYESASTGVIRLSDGKEIIPCKYVESSDISINNGFISVGKTKNYMRAAKVYDLDGKLIYDHPEQGLNGSAPGVLSIYQETEDHADSGFLVDTKGNVIMKRCYVHLPLSEGITYATIYPEGSYASETWLLNENFEKITQLDSKIHLSGSFDRGYCFGTLRGSGDNRLAEARVLVDSKGNIVWQAEFKTRQDGGYSGITPSGFDRNGYIVAFDTMHGGHILRLVEPSLDNFIQVNTYKPGTFADVAEGQWYTDGIQTAYELGLMKGVSGDSFGLEGTITVSSALAMAARVHSIYNTGSESFDQSEGSHWYDVYVNYCRNQGIFTQTFDDYNRPATRAEFAAILAGALPAEALQPQREWADDSIPDVKMGDPYAQQIYTLYRAGVLTGNDAQGTFTPGSQIGRSSAATIVARMAKVALRSKD